MKREITPVQKPGAAQIPAVANLQPNIAGAIAKGKPEPERYVPTAAQIQTARMVLGAFLHELGQSFTAIMGNLSLAQRDEKASGIKEGLESIISLFNFPSTLPERYLRSLSPGLTGDDIKELGITSLDLRGSEREIITKVVERLCEGITPNVAQAKSKLEALQSAEVFGQTTKEKLKLSIETCDQILGFAESATAQAKDKKRIRTEHYNGNERVYSFVS